VVPDPRALAQLEVDAVLLESSVNSMG